MSQKCLQRWKKRSIQGMFIAFYERKSSHNLVPGLLLSPPINIKTCLGRQVLIINHMVYGKTILLPVLLLWQNRQ